MITSSEQLTVILPTKDRGGFVSRILSGLAQDNVEWLIIIGDSSENDETEKEVRKWATTLRIDYQRFPSDFPLVDKGRQLSIKVSTPYLIPISDDDWYSVRAIEEAVEFLDANPGYSAAGGRSVYFSVDGDGVWGGISGVTVDALKSNELDDPMNRLHMQLATYEPTWYTVHRTDVMRDIYKAFIDISESMDLWIPELTEAAVTAIRGKIKIFAKPLSYMQIHGNRISSATTSNPKTILEWLLAPGAQNKIDHFVEVVSRVLADETKTDASALEIFVRHYFWCYLSHAFSQCATLPKKEVPRDQAKGGLVEAFNSWKRERSILKGMRSGEIPFDADLDYFSDPRFLYNNDFCKLKSLLSGQRRENCV